MEKCKEAFDAHPTGTFTSIKVAWISAHSGVTGNELADDEAKLAAMGKMSVPIALPNLLRKRLPVSTTALKQDFADKLRRKWGSRWRNSPRHFRITRFDDQFPLKAYIQGRDSLSRWQANLVTQIRTGHVPLNKYLHRIKRKDSPNCKACLKVGIEAPETPRHLLYECPLYDRERFLHERSLGRMACDLKYMMSHPSRIVMLAKYINSTERFKRRD